MGPLAELAPLVEAGGVLGILAIVIVYLMSGARRDRQDYRTAIGALEKRIAAERERTLAAETAIDVERALRRKAEDDAERRVDELQETNRVLRAALEKTTR